MDWDSFAFITLFTIWSRWILGKMWATNAAIKLEHQLIKVEHQLVTRGPYRITRNPIYSGILGKAPLAILFSPTC